jgi:tRNA pseudouridine55 synthase
MSRSPNGRPQQPRSKGLNINGWLVLDKIQGMTSTQAVGMGKRLFQAKKTGHAGTLDPLATGILPMAFGEATKTVPYVVGGAKSYRFTVRWGDERDTDDAEGQTVQLSAERPAQRAIEQATQTFIGEILQTPPKYSAIKVDGERAYDLARDGEHVELQARPVTIDRLVMTDMPDAQTSVFEAECGKGTYVRAIARDMGRMLGCFGHVIQLRRTRVGPFDESQAITVAQLHAAADAAITPEGTAALRGLLQPVEAALGNIPGISVNSSDAARLKRGQSVLMLGRDAPIFTGQAYALSRGQLIAIGEVGQGEFVPSRVFNYG